MTKNHVYEKDIPALSTLPLETVVMRLHGHSVHFHTLGISVAYEHHMTGAMRASVTDHYVKVDPIHYILELDGQKHGKQIFDMTYAVLNTYLAFSSLAKK